MDPIKSFLECDISAYSNEDKISYLNKFENFLSLQDKYYYQDNYSEINDSDYDKLKNYHAQVLEKYPFLKKESKYFESIGFMPSEKFSKVKHKIPMLSLSNIFDEVGLDDFYEKIRKYLNLSLDSTLEIVSEPKIDGLSASLLYKKGVLEVGATRGDGSLGEDVTENIRTISNIPKIIDSMDVPEILEVRGEIYMNKSDFISLNEEMLQQGKQTYVNPRNTASGSLRQIDPNITRSRKLNFFAYTWGQISNNNFDTHFEVISKFKEWGFSINPYTKINRSKNELIDSYSELDSIRSSLDYDIDGLVLKVNDLNYTFPIGEWTIAVGDSMDASKTWPNACAVSNTVDSLGDCGAGNSVDLGGDQSISVSRSFGDGWEFGLGLSASDGETSQGIFTEEGNDFYGIALGYETDTYGFTVAYSSKESTDITAGADNEAYDIGDPKTETTYTGIVGYYSPEELPITLSAGYEIGDPRKIEIMAKEAPFLVKEIGLKLGINVNFGTDPEYVDGKFTGKVLGRPNFSEEKVRRVEEWANGQEFEEIFAYSDSIHDLPLLEFSHVPFAISPDASLREVAAKRKWAIIDR